MGIIGFDINLSLTIKDIFILSEVCAPHVVARALYNTNNHLYIH